MQSLPRSSASKLGSRTSSTSECPICFENFPASVLEQHASACEGPVAAGDSGTGSRSPFLTRRPRDAETVSTPESSSKRKRTEDDVDAKPSTTLPLAEAMRPKTLDQLLGQSEVTGSTSMWRKLIDGQNLPSMILWGPPGCGKTSLGVGLSVIIR